MCKACLLEKHAHPHLHMFSTWQDGTFLPCSQDLYEQQKWHIPHDDCKGDKALNRMIIIDQKGREHIRSVIFCKCEEPPITLFRMGLWAGSPTLPKVAYQIDLLIQMRSLLLEGHVPIKTYCSALEFNNPPETRRISQLKNVYSSCFLESFEEFKHYMYSVQHPVEFISGLDDGAQCPACFSATTKVICLDADFQLVRKSSAGRQWETPKRKVFFHSQDEVENFVSMSSYKEENISNELCSDFQAGNNLRSKSKSAKLSDKGIFGSVCRHDIPHKFASLKHGERLAYPVFFLEKIKENLKGNKLYLSYDIACKLKKHVQIKKPELLENCHMMVPIFHCYGHQRPCQILFNPRRMAGAGLTDGEGIERLWSYLGRFSNISKEMKPETRQGLLSDGLLHFTEKKKKNIGHSLVARLKRAKVVNTTSTKALSDLKQLHPGINDEQIRKWTTEEIESVEKDTRVAKTSKNDTLFQIQSLAIERLFLKEQMRKYARGQSIAKRVGKQLSLNAKKLQKAIEDHNRLGKIPVTYNQVQELTWTQNYGPEILKRQLIDLKSMIERSMEEEQLIKEEMASVLEFYECQINVIVDACKNTITQFKPRFFLDIFRLKLQFNFLFELFKPFLNYSKYSKFDVGNEAEIIFMENSDDLVNIDSEEIDNECSVIEEDDDGLL